MKPSNQPRQPRSKGPGKQNKNVNAKPQQAPPVKQQNQPAPRRTKKGKGYVPQGSRAQAIKSGQLILPVQDLVCGQGIVTTISVKVSPETQAVNALPYGLVSMAMSRQVSNPYAFYLAIYEDIVDIMKGGVGVRTSRLAYLNSILAAYAPKTVPFKLNTTFAFEFNTDALVQVPPAQYTLRSYTYYMWLPSNITIGQFKKQVPPGAVTDDDITSTYIEGLNLLAGKESQISIVRNVDLSTYYLKDCSAYARNSPYYGEGVAEVGSPYGSCECEVPYKSPLLGTLTTFNAQDPRSSRKLRLTSGDSCSNFAIGANRYFPTASYNSAIPPIYKFLDFNELAYMIAESIGQALTMSSATPTTANFNQLQGGIPISYYTFLLLLRQQIMWMFTDSQCLAQFLTFDSGLNDFEPFRDGSNCCGVKPAFPMLLPQIINENLKMLKMVVKSYHTDKYDSPRNKTVYIPVWGVFKNFGTVDPTFQSVEGISSIFRGPDVETPNLIDGVYLGNVLDLNNNAYLNGALASFNYFMTKLSPFFYSLESIG